MNIKHPTTRQHYEKYRDMAKERKVTLENTTDFLGYNNVPCNYALEDTRRPDGITVTCNACWACMYRLDNALNSVQLRKFDHMAIAYNMYRGRRSPLTLAEGVCMYKHLVIFEILGAEPVFVGQI